MSYFLSIDDINKVEEKDLDESNIKLMAQYDITDNERENLDSPNVSVQNSFILCCKENIVKKLLNSGKLSKLPSEEGFVASKFAESLEENNNSWINRVNFRTVDNVGTFLSVRNDTDCGNMKFENGEEIQFDHEFSEILEVEFNGRYLAILIGGINGRKCQVYPYCLVLIEIIRKSDHENVLMEIFRTNLQEIFRNVDFGKIIFNKNLSSKMLLIIQDLTSFNLAFVAFDITNFEFSAAFKLETELNSELVSEKVAIEEHYALKDNIYYFYHNVLKDVIVIVTVKIVYVIKQKFNSNTLFTYKRCLLPIHLMKYGSELCNNRNNEFLLFFPANISKIHGNVIDIKVGVIAYDILNDILCRSFCNSNGNSNSIFFNKTGEEIFIVDKNKLNVFVYKSRVRSLKKTCQLVVLERYTSEQLDQMNLPKYILTSG